jgi:hypothetical protein
MYLPVDADNIGNMNWSIAVIGGVILLPGKITIIPITTLLPNLTVTQESGGSVKRDMFISKTAILCSRARLLLSREYLLRFE